MIICSVRVKHCVPEAEQRGGWCPPPSLYRCSTWRRGLSSRKWKVSVSSLYRYSTVPALTYCTILARVTAAYNRASSSCVQRVKLQQTNDSHHIYCGLFFMQRIQNIHLFFFQRSYQPYVTTTNNFLKINTGRLINAWVAWTSRIMTACLCCFTYITSLHVSNSCGKSRILINKLICNDTSVCISGIYKVYKYVYKKSWGCLFNCTCVHG